MSFVDHLEQLRWHLIRSVIAIVIGAILVFIYVKEIVSNVLMAPADPGFITYKYLCSAGHFFGLGNQLCLAGVKVSFISTEMTGQFISSFTIAFIGGFVVAFPYVFWEFWKFIRPALNPKELKRTGGVIFWVSFLFFLFTKPPYRGQTQFFRLFRKSYLDNRRNRRIVSNAAACCPADKDWHPQVKLFKKIPPPCLCHYSYRGCDHYAFH